MCVCACVCVCLSNGDYVREMTAKKSCKYGEYGSFQHLLFLLLQSRACILFRR